LIKLPDGRFVRRSVKVTPFGNFQMMTVVYNGEEYIIGSGDEYIRDEPLPEYFELGKKIGGKK